MTLDPRALAVRSAIYDTFVREGRGATVEELSKVAGVPLPEVRRSLGELAAAHAIVLRHDSDAIWMAAPFSGIPTAFLVTADQPGNTAGAWWANCAWDALGIAAALAAAGSNAANGAVNVHTICADCGDAISLVIDAHGAEPVRAVAADGTRFGSTVLHFAVPAARWWDDIGFT